MGTRLRAIVTAGGTSEPIDDVRTVTNASTGRFGAAIARSLHARGVDVTVIGSAQMLGHSSWLPDGVTQVPFRSTESLAVALDDALDRGVDLLFMAAAVSDYTPDPADGKIRSDADQLTVHMHRTPKILPTLRARCGDDAVVVGFKLLSNVPADTLVDVARHQRDANHLTLTIANDLQDLTPTHHPVWIVGDTVRRVTGPRDTVADQVAAAALEAVPGTRPALSLGTPVEAPAVGRARHWWHVAGGHCEAPHTTIETPAEHLAHRRTVPTAPLALPAPDGVWVGCAAEDRRAWFEPVQRATARARALGATGTTHIAWYRGLPAALLVDDDSGARTILSTRLVDDDVWPQAVLVHDDHASRPWRVPADELAGWTQRGFACVHQPDQRRAHVLPPWFRDDTMPAASACLVHVPSRTVLLGRRAVAPARGAIAFPGGRPEAGETAAQAARRELREETGLLAPVTAPWFHHVVWRGGEPAWRITCHVWRVATREDPEPTDELVASWRSLDAARTDREVLPGVRVVLDRIADLLDRS